MTCYIFGAGECIVQVSPTDADFVIAADGGLRHVEKIGMRPDLVIGDFDSLGYVPQCDNLVRLPIEKDMTDLAAAVDIGRARGYRRFVLLGGTGGRPDHTYANYQLLYDLAAHGEEGYLVGADFSATVIKSGTSLTFDQEFCGTLSVFAVGGKATGVTERGTKYTLEGATLTPENPLGVSNAFIGQKASVSVNEGALLVMWEGQGLPAFAKTKKVPL